MSQHASVHIEEFGHRRPGGLPIKVSRRGQAIGANALRGRIRLHLFEAEAAMAQAARRASSTPTRPSSSACSRWGAGGPGASSPGTSPKSALTPRSPSQCGSCEAQLTAADRREGRRFWQAKARTRWTAAGGSFNLAHAGRASRRHGHLLVQEQMPMPTGRHFRRAEVRHPRGGAVVARWGTVSPGILPGAAGCRGDTFTGIHQGVRRPRTGWC
jgi:hypothetical protein